MEKIIKIKSDLFQQETIYLVSEELNKLQGKNLAPQKLEQANEMLRNLKTPLPE